MSSLSVTHLRMLEAIEQTSTLSQAAEQLHVTQSALTHRIREENYGQSAITLARMTPSYLQRVSSLGGAYAQLGYKEAARAAAKEFRSLVESRPGCPRSGNSEGWRPYWRLLYRWGNEENFEKLLEGFGKAGLPV